LLLRLFLPLLPPPPSSTLFPYTTLFRSRRAARGRGRTASAPRRRRPNERPHPSCGGRGPCCRPGTCPAIRRRPLDPSGRNTRCRDRKSTRLNSSHLVISYAVFCLKKKTK